ncbi:hypothetical protein COO60DRAFT_446776 [Scenedesmus sp. NREL 46B-D3]|nr:hypothetical protein COO60DRAFT_446776 [Scenedesmus sp. NREL 46B-D3]
MDLPSSIDDLLVAGLVCLVTLVALITTLYLNRENSVNIKKESEKEEEAGGTVLVEEGGRTVRRSTRQHKPVLASDEIAKSPAITKTPRGTRTAEAGSTPLTAARTPRTAERPTSPARGRRATAKSPAPGSRHATKSPGPAQGTSNSPATTPRRGPGRPRKEA